MSTVLNAEKRVRQKSASTVRRDFTNAISKTARSATLITTLICVLLLFGKNQLGILNPGMVHARKLAYDRLRDDVQLAKRNVTVYELL